MEKALEKAQSYIGGQNKIAGVANVLGRVGGFAAGGGFDGLFKGGGTDTLGVSDLQSFGRSAADIKTLALALTDLYNSKSEIKERCDEF